MDEAVALARAEPAAPLLRVEEARRILAECRDIDEAKAIRDTAEAVRIYTRQRDASREAQNDAGEIKLRAERRLGQLLKEQKDRGERRDRGRARKTSQAATFEASASAPALPPPTLEEMGITRDSASRWTQVAEVPEEHFEEHIRQQRAAPSGEVTTAGLLKEAKRTRKEKKKAEQLEQIKAYVPPAGEFPVIVTDKAWPYDNQLEADGARGGTPYPQATLEEIKAQVPPMAKDCVIFIWCTNQHLIGLEAPVHQVMRAWGVTPRALITWTKDRMGLGSYVRNKTEQCILATRGSPKLNLTNQTTDLQAPRGAHSAKPDEFYRMVEELCPARPLLELDSRKPRAGWVTSGAELPAPPCLCGHELTAHGPDGCSKCTCELYEYEATSGGERSARGAGPRQEKRAGHEQPARSSSSESDRHRSSADASPPGIITFEDFRERAREAGFKVKLSWGKGEEYFTARCSAVGCGCHGATLFRVRKEDGGVLLLDAALLLEHRNAQGLRQRSDVRKKKRAPDEIDKAIARGMKAKDAPHYAAALNFYRHGLDMCPWCGKELSERGGGVVSGMKGGRYGLPLCTSCSRSGHSQIYVAKKHHDAWRAVLLKNEPERTRRKNAKAAAAAAAEPRVRRTSPPPDTGPTCGAVDGRFRHQPCIKQPGHVDQGDPRHSSGKRTWKDKTPKRGAGAGRGRRAKTSTRGGRQ
jgi:N6-adenosine-specific RNA methylase IME4